MSLPGLLRVIADDPQLRRALEEADAPGSPGADLIAPPALRPFLAAALAAGRRDGRPERDGGRRSQIRARGDRHRPRGRGTHRRARLAAARRHGRVLPALGDAPARAALPALRHLGAAAGRAAPAGPPRPGRPEVRPADRGRRPGALPAPAHGRRARRARAGPAAPGRHGGPRRPGRPARGHRLRAGRPGREARRPGRARRHPRRVPAHRRAPAADRVLRRHRRGDPVLPGRRPAQPEARARTGCGRRRAASCC